MTLKEEMEKAAKEGGRYIPPYQLREMMKIAGKIVTMLTDNMAAVTFSYGDMKTVLHIVEHTLEQGYKEGERDETDDNSTQHRAGMPDS